MRMILVMIALVTVALLAAKQLQGPDSAPAAMSVPAAEGQPGMPTRPQDVPAFEQDINAFTLESAEARANQLDEMER